MKKRLSLLAASGILAFSSLAFQGVASAAVKAPTAHPTGCSAVEVYAETVGAECKRSNGGHYKAIAVCKAVVGGQVVTREAGVWKSSGMSIVHCPPGTYLTRDGMGYMTRGY